MREKKLASTLNSYALGTSPGDVTSREAWQLLGIMSEFAGAIFRHAERRSFAPLASERGSLLKL